MKATRISVVAIAGILAVAFFVASPFFLTGHVHVDHRDSQCSVCKLTVTEIDTQRGTESFDARLVEAVAFAVVDPSPLSSDYVNSASVRAPPSA